MSGALHRINWIDSIADPVVASALNKMLDKLAYQCMISNTN